MTVPLPAAAHTTSGRPSYQHDRHLIHHTSNASLYVIADGHGSAKHGHKVSQHIVTTLPQLLRAHNAYTPCPETPSRLRAAISSLDASAIATTSAARVYAGSTLCAVLRMGTTLLCANVGDSRAVVIPATGHPRQLSTDHICTNPTEKSRIENAGGVVIGGLLNGYISMSRAIGDDDLKAHRNLTPFPFNEGKKFGHDLFIGDADVTHDRIRDADLVTVVASDGVWGKLSNNDVAAVVKTEIRKGRSAEEIAKAVVKKAISKGSKDNVTAVVAFLREEAVARMLAGGEKKRKHRTGNASPKTVTAMVKEMRIDEGWDTATSSDGGATISTDALAVNSSRNNAKARKQGSNENGRASNRRRSRWGQRNQSNLR